MDEKTAALKARFDDFSRRLDAATRKFETTGELAEDELTESVRKRHEAAKIDLDRAIQAGAVPEILRLQLERDFDALAGEFLRLEKKFHAAAMRDSKRKS